MASSAEKQLARQLTAARMLLAENPKGRLVLSKLEQKPAGLNGATTAFEFLKGNFLRMCFEFKGQWVEAMPIAVSNNQRKSLAESLGFNSGTHEEVPVPATAAYLRERIYFTSEEQKGGV